MHASMRGGGGRGRAGGGRMAYSRKEEARPRSNPINRLLCNAWRGDCSCLCSLACAERERQADVGSPHTMSGHTPTERDHHLALLDKCNVFGGLHGSASAQSPENSRGPPPT